MADSTVRLVFTSQSGDAVRGVKQIEGAFSSLEKTGARAARAIGTVAFGAIAAGIGVSVKQAVDFDRAMRNVNSIAHVSESQFKTLEKQVLSLARSSGQAPKVLAAGLYDIVSSGFKAKDALTILDASAKAARAGMTDTATSTKGVVAVLNAYHLQARDAARVSDELFQTVNVGVINFGELASQIGDVLPFASSLGVGLDQVGASIATLTKEGLSGAEAVTRIKAVFTQFLSPSKDLAKAIKGVGFENGEALLKAKGFQGALDALAAATHGSKTEMAKLFPDVRSLGGALGLTGENSRSAKRDLDQLKDSTGATGRAFDEQSKSISAQWQKFTAIVTTGAIDIGQRAFPILAAAISTGSEAFDKLKVIADRNMPQIESAVRSAISRIRPILSTMLDDGKRLFAQLEPIAVKVFDAIVGAGQAVAPVVGGIASVIGDLASALGAAPILAAAGTFIGISAAISGVAGALEALAASGGIVALIANPLFLIPAAAAVAVGALIALGGSFDSLSDKVRNTTSALNDYGDAQLGLQGAHLATERAIINAQRAQNEYEAAVRASARTQRAYDRAVADGHTSAAETAKLADKNTKAKQRERDAALNLSDAELRVSEAKARESAASDKLKQQSDTLEGALSAQIKTALDSNTTFKTLSSTKGNARKQTVDYQKAVDDLAQSFVQAANHGKGLTKEQRTADMAIANFIATTRRIPTEKELKLIIDGVLDGTANLRDLKAGLDALHDKNIDVTVRTTELGGAHKRRAMGGFVDGPAGAGDVVPALLTPGEVVLNDRQQQMIGKGKIMDVLGATGGVMGGARFAKGGIVQAGHGLAHKLSASVRSIVAAIEGTQLAESDNERTYGQLDREFSISQEQYIVTDAAGNEQIDSSAVNQRLSEIARLESSRKGLMGLLDREKDQLAAAVAALKRSIDQLNPMIRRARTQAQTDARTVAGIERDLSKERAKKHPSKSRIQALEARKKKITKRKSTLDGYVGDWTGLINDWRGLSKDEAQRLHDVPFDRRDAELGIMELEAEAAGIRATRPAPPSGGSGLDASGDASGDAELQALVAQLKQALNIGDVQSAIVGSFARGTINVPETGLALVHAGETIIPDAQSARVAGMGGAAPVVNISFADGMDWLRQFMQVTIDGQMAQISAGVNRRLGDRADGLRRSGAVR